MQITPTNDRFLPLEAAQLAARLQRLEAQQKSNEEEKQQLRENNLHLQEENRLLKEKLNWFQQQMFGRSSEKRKAEDILPDQGNLFNEAEALADPASETSESVTIPAHTRKKRGRKAISADLPRVEVIHDIPEQDKTCAEHQVALEVIGQEISEQCNYIPATVEIQRHIRLKYACPCCQNNIKLADKPKQILPKSNATPSLLAHIVTAKYVDGLPLHRQERQFERLGLPLGRATMANWMIKLGEKVIPLINLLNDHLLDSPLIHCDETRLQVLKGRDSQQHWMWVRGGGPPGKKVVLFDHDPTRSGAVPQRLLAGYGGILVTDGYDRYDAAVKLLRQTSPTLIHCGCLAHCRRYFKDAEKMAGGEGHARTALDFIGQLYKTERTLRERDATPEEKYRVRQEKSKPVVEAFKAWLDKLALQVLPKGKLGEAVHYALSQWHKLVRFLDNGLIPLDNNWAENAIRPFVIGRKAWLFSATPRGADASARLYSLVESAKANGLEPHAYLARVFSELPKAACVEDYEALLPWNVKRTLQAR